MGASGGREGGERRGGGGDSGGRWWWWWGRNKHDDIQARAKDQLPAACEFQVADEAERLYIAASATTADFVHDGEFRCRLAAEM